MIGNVFFQFIQVELKCFVIRDLWWIFALVTRVFEFIDETAMRVKRIKFWIVAMAAAAAFFGCRPRSEDVAVARIDSHDKTRGIYHWKTTFDLTEKDKAFMKDHQITQLYVRMFDVGIEDNWDSGSGEVVPLGTTVFKCPVPEGCHVIPTVYITLDALKAYKGREPELADLIVERVYAMASWNDLGEIKEIQYDCDWTAGTRPLFERLCEHTRKQIAGKGAILSGTIRLHQIEEAYYPFDKGVVMIYNTGSLKDASATNSILHYDDVSKYLSVEKRINKFLKARNENCPVIEIAYPTYSWGVVYDYFEKTFKRLVSSKDEYEGHWSEYVRWETSEITEIIKVKGLVDKTIGRAGHGNVIYHLDSDNLTKYNYDEIENIYN